MKKVIYSLALVLVGLTSCAGFDDPVTENYGAGPAVDLNVTAAIPTDSAFTISISPAQGTLYYAFIIDENDEAETVDGYALLKGSFGNDVVSAKEHADTTIVISDATPNTTYQVYAVAANDKGVVGEVVVKSITTTDKLTPTPKKGTADADNAAYALEFSEPVDLGEGLISAKYYKEWDIENPVEVPEEDIDVDIDGAKVTFSAANIPAGAYLCFSYEAGAFKDSAGQPCAALESGLNMTTGKFTNLWLRVTPQPFDVTDEMVTDPEDGSLVTDAEAFKGEIELPFDIYRSEEDVETGDLSVTYSGESRTVSYKLTAEQWAIEGNTLTFTLPVTPENKDVITFSIVEGAFTDVYGNLNNAFESKVSWTFSTYAPTKEDVLGTFSYLVTLKANGNTYNLGDFTISEYTGADAEPGDVVISGLYLGEDAENIYGYYDLEAAKFYIYRYQPLGTYVDEGVTYGVLTYNMEDAQLIEFDLTEEGIVSTTFALAYSDAEYTQLGGYEVPAGTTVFAKAAPAARKAASFKKPAVSKKSTGLKNVKGTPRKVKALRK